MERYENNVKTIMNNDNPFISDSIVSSCLFNLFIHEKILVNYAT